MVTQLESEKLEDDDTFLTEQAPAMLAQAYLNTAAKAAESSASDAYKNALTLAKAGFALAPENEALAEAVASYTEEVANRKAVTELGELFKSSDALKALDVASVGEAMKSAQSRFPDEYADFRKGWAADRSDSLLAYAQKGDKIEAFAGRVSEFERLFPEEKGAVRKQAAEMFDKRIRGVGAVHRRRGARRGENAQRVQGPVGGASQDADRGHRRRPRENHRGADRGEGPRAGGRPPRRRETIVSRARSGSSSRLPGPSSSGTKAS